MSKSIIVPTGIQRNRCTSPCYSPKYCVSLYCNQLSFYPFVQKYAFKATCGAFKCSFTLFSATAVCAAISLLFCRLFHSHDFRVFSIDISCNIFSWRDNCANRHCVGSIDIVMHAKQYTTSSNLKINY